MFLPKKKKKKNRSLELFQISRQISFSSSKDKIRRGWKKNFLANEFTKFLKREKFENFVGIRLIRLRDEREGNERRKKKERNAAVRKVAFRLVNEKRDDSEKKKKKRKKNRVKSSAA